MTQDESPELTDLLTQFISEFQRLNVNLEQLNQRLTPSVTSSVPLAVSTSNQRQPSSSSLRDHHSVDTSALISEGDDVIIIQRARGQYGVIGTVYKVTNDFYKIRTPLGKEYQKKKKFVARYYGNRNNPNPYTGEYVFGA